MKVLSNQQNVKLQRHLDLDDKIEATENVEGLSYRPRTAETREVREPTSVKPVRSEPPLIL